MSCGRLEIEESRTEGTDRVRSVFVADRPDCESDRLREETDHLIPTRGDYACPKPTPGMKHRNLQKKSPYLVLGVGGVLFLIALAHHVIEFYRLNQLENPVFALALDGPPALGLAYAGYWLTGTDLSAEDRWQVSLWSLAGLTLFFGVMGLSVVVRASEGRPVGEAILPLLIAAEVGGLAGVAGGYQTARARVQTRRTQAVSDELRQQRERLELALSGTNTALVELDLETDAVTRSETFVELVGAEPDSIEEFYRAVHPDDRDRIRRGLETMIETGETWTGRFRVNNTDTTQWLKTRATPVYDEKTPTRILATATDISALKAREQEVLEEREQFRLLIESVEEYVFLVVDEDGTIQTWNDSAEDLFGYNTGTALDMSMAELHPETDRESERPERLLQQARIAGESTHEGRRVCADGSEFYADVRHVPLEADDGAFRGFAMIVRDLTDQRQQQRRTERFVEESNEVIAIVDPDGTVAYVSGSVGHILGYHSDSLVGENFFDYLHPETREDTMETFFSGLESPEATLQFESRIRSGSGEWLNIEGQCRNMLDDDAISGMLLYLRESVS